MNNYNYAHRRIGQIDTGGYELNNFMGPVELWHHKDSGKYFVYLYLSVELNPWTTDVLNINRSDIKEATRIYNLVCDIASHLPYRHKLNYVLSPYSPNSQQS